uniref:PRELI domain-containing protein 1, mitochondrial n=1 Tax=Caligus rogercresseyi TaxID=217165 RepID=C1BPN8_CALRO|nr:PRELI domain-containing protein 1, mitochondrial precursor [Caligus rogercresseyi]
MKTNKLPSWGRHFFSVRHVPVIEETLIDPFKKEIRTYTRNIGLRTFMGTTERATYTWEEPGSTRIVKEVWIESDIFGFRGPIQKFGVERFKNNCVKATEGFDYVLSQLFGQKL